MKLKSLLIAATLLLSGSAAAQQFGFWESQPERQMISTHTQFEDGSQSQAVIHLDGTVGIAAYPAGWDIDDTRYTERNWKANISVNGQAVKYNFTRTANGGIHGYAATYKGAEYVRNEFWSKSRVVFKFGDKATGSFSAKGVQAAWQHLKSNQAI